MEKLVITTLSCLSILASLLPDLAAARDVSVRGYYRGNGTYVQPYQRTSPNDTVCDNYSYKGGDPSCGAAASGSYSPGTTAPSSPSYSGEGPCSLIPMNYPDWRSNLGLSSYMRSSCGM